MKFANKLAHNLKDIKESLIIVFWNRPIYIFLAILIAFVIFSLFIFLANIPIFFQAWSVSKISLFPKIALNIVNTILAVSGKLQLGLMIALAFLGGINISIVIFKISVTKRIGGTNLAGVSGLVGSAFGVGCPACSTSLLSVLGIGGGLSVLPFKGIEITSLGVIILLISFYFIAKSVSECEECKLK